MNKGIFYILDKDSFEIIYLIENYKYALWTDRYDECGDFEIQVPPSDAVIKAAKKDNYVINPSNKVDAQTMIIEDYNLVQDESGETLLKLSGRSTESILDRRIIGMKTIFRNNLENAIRQLIKHCFVDLNFIVIGADPPDGIQRPSNYRVENLAFIFSNNSDIESVNIDVTEYGIGANVLQIITELCQANNLGFQMPLVNGDLMTPSIYGTTNEHMFQFKLVKYVDRSDKVVFSRKMDNLVSSDYKKEAKDSRNVFYIYGKEYDTSENPSNKTVQQCMHKVYDYETKSFASGLYVREYATDASDLNFKTNDIYGNEVTLSSSDYQTLFFRRADKLEKDYDIKEESDAKIIEGDGYRYNKDFFIGDLVGADDGYGDHLKVQVCEYITSYDQNGIVGYPKFRVFKG